MLQFIEDILTEFREQPELLTKTISLYLGKDIIILCEVRRSETKKEKEV